jgi:hypothetical protein
MRTAFMTIQRLSYVETGRRSTKNPLIPDLIARCHFPVRSMEVSVSIADHSVLSDDYGFALGNDHRVLVLR